MCRVVLDLDLSTVLRPPRRTLTRGMIAENCYETFRRLLQKEMCFRFFRS